MKLLKKISFSLLTLLCGTQLMANNCLSQDECCDAPSSIFCLDNLTFRAEGLYLWAGESDLQYASQNHYSQTEVNSTTLTKIKSKYNSPDFSNRLGYRVGLDYLHPCSCIGFGVTYFHFKTNAEGTVCTPIYATSTGKIGSESTFVSPLFGSSVNEQNPFNKSHANLKLQVNLLDFDFGKTFCYNSCFNFRPFIGVRYADISENYRIKSHGYSSGSDRLQNIVTKEQNYLKNEFTGFGIHGGLDCGWSFGCGLSLYGKTAASILYGRTHRSSLADYLSNDFTGGTITGSEQCVKGNQRGPRTIFELEIGVKYAYCFCNNAIDLKLGWTQIVFLNNNRFDNSISGGKGASYAFNRNGDLGLQGIVFGAEYAF